MLYNNPIFCILSLGFMQFRLSSFLKNTEHDRKKKEKGIFSQKLINLNVFEYQ